MVNDPLNAKLIGPNARTQLTSYKNTLTTLKDNNNTAQTKLDTMNNPNSLPDDITAAYKWLFSNRDKYSITKGQELDSIVQNPDFMDSARYTGVRILNRSPKMAIDIQTMFDEQIRATVAKYDSKTLTTDDLEQYAVYLPEALKKPTFEAGPYKNQRDAALRKAFEQYGRPQVISGGAAFLNNFDDLFVSNEGKNLYLKNASESERTSTLEKLIIGHAYKNSNNAEFIALQTGEEGETLTKFGNLFLSDKQIDFIEKELLNNGFNRELFGPEPEVEETVGDNTDKDGNNEDINLGANDVVLAKEDINVRIENSINQSARAFLTMVPRGGSAEVRKQAGVDEEGNVIPLTRNEVFTEDEQALSAILTEKNYLDGISATRSLTQDELSRYNQIEAKIKPLRETREGRKAIKIMESGNMAYFNNRAITVGKKARTLKKEIANRDAIERNISLIENSLSQPGDRLVVIGPPNEKIVIGGRNIQKRSVPTGQVVSRKQLEFLLKQANIALAQSQKKVGVLTQKYEDSTSLLNSFLLVNNVNEETNELISQYFIPKTR